MKNEIANTILQQLGGLNRIVAMTGARNAVNLSNGVCINLPRGGKLTIALNSADLYDVDWSRFSMKTLETKNIDFRRNVSVAELKSVCETMTKLRFSL